MTPRPHRAGSGANAVPPSSTVLVASLTAQTLGVVTDRDIYGPVTVTNADRVAQVARLINNAPPRVAAVARCPMEGTGNLTIVFESSASGPPAATVIISTSGCPGITVRPAAGGVIGLDGGAGHGQADRVDSRPALAEAGRLSPTRLGSARGVGR